MHSISMIFYSLAKILTWVLYLLVYQHIVQTHNPIPPYFKGGWRWIIFGSLIEGEPNKLKEGGEVWHRNEFFYKGGPIFFGIAFSRLSFSILKRILPPKLSHMFKHKFIFFYLYKCIEESHSKSQKPVVSFMV